MSGTSVCGEEKRSKRRRGSGIGRTDRYCRRAYTIAPAGGTCRTKITTDFAASSTKKRADGPLAVGAAPLRCGFAGEFRGHFQEDLDCRSDGNRQVSGEKGSCFGEVHRFCFRSVEPDFQTRRVAELLPGDGERCAARIHALPWTPPRAIEEDGAGRDLWDTILWNAAVVVGRLN
jgi:hypothetical protein